MAENQGTAAFICSRDTLDGAYPALVLGINARRLEMDAKVFFTFMGLNVIRKGWLDNVKFHPPGAMGAVPGMASIATWMMKSKMEKAQIPGLEDILTMAQMEGVEFIACRMTVDMMELTEDDFIEDVTVWTAEEFLKFAKDCKISLFT
ncbi:DsrE/DsrF/DrsH-like family protein [Thermodesulfobacteriota bacterium]